MKTYSLLEIKAAAWEVIARMSDDPDILKMFFGMDELISQLEEAVEPEPEKVAEAKEKTMEKVGKMESAPKKSRNGPCKVVQPGKFTGYGAVIKRQTYEKMMNLRTMEGKTITEISEMTAGKVTPDEVRAMCGTRKVEYAKWAELAKALGVAV